MTSGRGLIHGDFIVPTSTLQRIHLLPEEVQKQVSDFIEFLMSKRKKRKVRQPVFGSAKGRIHMSADFDEPLDDFKV